MEQLCRKINMPEEVTQELVSLDRTMEELPCLDLLMREETRETGLLQLKDALGEDPRGLKRLCCMLRCAKKTEAMYAQLAIPERIYVDTMAAFSRFVREYKQQYGFYGFNRGSWTPRQVSCRLFRIGQLEYELTVLHGAPAVSLHIPTDVDFRPNVLHGSLRDGLEELYRLFPAYRNKTVFCHSWLLSPLLKDLLPATSNILRFQQLFDIVPDTVPCNDVLLWVFQNPNLPKEDLPENTDLQRKLKRFFLDGGTFCEGRGTLRLPIPSV